MRHALPPVVEAGRVPVPAPSRRKTTAMTDCDQPPATYHRSSADSRSRQPGRTSAVRRRLDREPIPWPGANPSELNGNVLRDTMLGAFYSDANFPALAGLMKAALTSGPLPAPSTPPDVIMQNSAAATAATMCNDVEWPGSVPLHQRLVARDKAAHPLTAGMPVNMGPCAFWPYRPAEQPVRVTSRGPSNVLLVQNLRDPSTPHSGALEMREAFGQRARMVSVDSGGHGAYLANGNACGDRTVTEFLVSGRRPAQDTLCD